MTWVKRRKAWRMSRAHRYRDIQQSSFSKFFSHFTYVTTHSPTIPPLYLHHSSFSNPSVASPTSQLILQPFFRFSYLTGFSLMSPGEPPMPLAGLRFIRALRLHRTRVYQFHNDMDIFCLFRECINS